MKHNTIKYDENEFPSKGEIKDKILFLLKYAVLAPSTHNSQPWLVQIEGNKCKVYADREVKITEADPVGRDMYISIGCFLENLLIAAGHFSVFYQLKVNSIRDQNLPVLEIEFNSTGQLPKRHAIDRNKHLFQAIEKRRNTRYKFEERAIPKGVIEECLHFAEEFNHSCELSVFTSEDQIQAVANLTSGAIKEAYEKSSFRVEMSEWINNNFSKKKRGLFGYALGVPAPISLVLPFVVKYFNIGWKIGGLSADVVRSAPALFVIEVQENSPENWIKVGQLAELLMLHLNASSLKTAIYVAAIEIGNNAKQLEKILCLKNKPAFLFVAGFNSFEQPAAPRYTPESLLIPLDS